APYSTWTGPVDTSSIAELARELGGWVNVAQGASRWIHNFNCHSCICKYHEIERGPCCDYASQAGCSSPHERHAVHYIFRTPGFGTASLRTAAEKDGCE